MSTLSSLAAAIRSAGVDIVGVSGAQGSIRIDYRGTPSPAQITTAEGVRDAFDWAAAAEATRVAQAAKVAANGSIDDSALPKGIPLDRLVRAIALVMLDEINLIRANFATPMTPRTAAQIMPALKTKIAGTAE